MSLISGDFWLGLEKIHHLVQEGKYNLLIELEDWEGNSQAVQFVFSLGGESTAYTLNLLGPLSGELENAIGEFRQLPSPLGIVTMTLKLTRTVPNTSQVSLKSSIPVCALPFEPSTVWWWSSGTQTLWH